MYHAYTIGHDFDLDYSNQIQITDDYTKLGFYFNGKQYVPKHPIGPGIFAAPFAFIGKILQTVNSNINFSENNITFFIYSLSSIFYFFTSILLISKVINNSPKFNKTSPISIFYLFLGSGFAYYSFERFSMTHTYEVFSVAVLFYIAFKNPNGDKAYINNNWFYSRTIFINSLGKYIYFSNSISLLFFNWSKRVYLQHH